MRQIKFRFWHKELKEYTTDLHYSPVIVNGEIKSSFHDVEQFTGLKDKNEKEIYEGDICKCERSLNDEIIDTHIGIMTWDDIHKNYYFHSVKNELSRTIGGKEIIEVIGNIHE